MDEEDSQDEQINRTISHGKGKRPAMSIFSDDEDNSEDNGESEEEETGSENDDNEVGEVLDEEDEEDESEDEDCSNFLEGAVGNVPVETEDLSSDEDSEKCPICLNSFHKQPVATPETCEHYFCLDCILEWSKNANSCPVDRIVFSNIILRKCHGGNVQKTIAVKKPVKPGEEQVEVDLDQTSCEVCGGQDREDRLLLCDGCDAGYHMECLTPPLDAVPVEEWFCPECIASNRTSGSEHISEEESSSLPTTSHSRSRPTRAIARTQQSERVRANVNRHRITQARTAAQLAPRYMMQSTWLDETINAVVAGLNTAVYIRDLTPRSKPHRRRKAVKRRKTKSKSSANSRGKLNMEGKRRKRKVRRSKLKRKRVVKKETNSRGRITRSLGIKKPKPGSIIPSVYRPSEYSLGSMRAEIGAASLSVYGDPFDLDPFNDREDEIQVPTPSSILDAKRRGLSRSALRSHQPVARPISASLSRQALSNPQVAEASEEAPIPDLLGSILSGQSMLLMDSCDVVINRDGSLKATKPVSLSLPRHIESTVLGSGETGNPPNSETSLIHISEEAGPSFNPLRRHPQVHNSLGSGLATQNASSSPIHCPHPPYSNSSPLGYSHPFPEAPHRTITLNPQRSGNGHLITSAVRSQPLSKVSNGPADSSFQNKDNTAHPPIRKPPPKPVWVDVSVLPRIPKIKRDSTSSANTGSGISSNTLPVSSTTTLTGNTGREQQGTGTSQQNRTVDVQRQRADRTGASSSFSSSFTSTTSSFSASSNSRPSSSSISFRINTTGNPWQARRLPASGGTLPGNEEETVKKNNKSKQLLLSERTKAKKSKSEVYDPFNPTGSDSSDNEPEIKGPDVNTRNNQSRTPVSENSFHQIKTEPVDVDSDIESSLEMCAEVKIKPDPFRDKPCKQSPNHSTAILSQAVAGDPIVNCTMFEDSMASAICDTTESQFMKIEEHSKPSFSCSVENVKCEVKSMPEAGPPPIRPQSKSLGKSLTNPQQVSQRNLVCKELVSGAFNDTNVKMDKEERPHQSQSKDRKRSPSYSQDLSCKNSHGKKHCRSKEKRQSRSRSRDRQRSRSKSKERQRSRSNERRCQQTRDRRCSSSSSSRERKASGKKTSHERNDYRKRERQRTRLKESRHSRCSYSRSRSREKRRTSKDLGENLLKRQNSKSTSRECKMQSEQLEMTICTERSSQGSAEPMFVALHEPSVHTNKSTASVKTERDARAHEGEFTSVKQETYLVDIRNHDLKSAEDNKEDILLDLHKQKEMRQKELWPITADEELKDIKKEELCFTTLGELDGVKEMKKEMSIDMFSKKSPNHNEMNFKCADLKKNHADFQEEMKVQKINVEPKNIKSEQIWYEEDYLPTCSDNPLVISLDTPNTDAVNCKKEPTESYQLAPLEENMEMSPLKPPEVPIKQEPAVSSDEDISVDYLIDNLDFIKKEISEGSMPDSAEAVNPQFVGPLAPAGSKQLTEMVTTVVRSKSQVKRVTWNLEETREPQSEKLSKLALFKLKLKQDGPRRSATTPQASGQGKASSQAAKLASIVSSPPPQDESSKPKSHKDVSQDTDQKEKYMKKLHMQERAIEEVKLAIKPFYQKRDITKEEYKEILRKAVQKVCHSKSGEINPVKVANLVKAYVDKYKHARKQTKEETGQFLHKCTE